MEILSQYGLFLAETLTIVLAIIAVLLVIASLSQRVQGDEDGEIRLTELNKRYRHTADTMHRVVSTKAQHKAFAQAEKARRKTAKKEDKREEAPRKRVFVLDFHGDIRAGAVAALREEISAILLVATSSDEVLLRLESPGGMVHGYGLAASQLVRLRERNIPLTVAVDKVAASGGYMMACVADRIVAAPFAVVGSIGVVAQIPNFNKLLKSHNVDVEMLTAGEHKRTLTLFGENTPKGRAKMREELEETHALFRSFVQQYRPQLKPANVFTGEHWHGSVALEHKLVDGLQTSDDYLFAAKDDAELYHVAYWSRAPIGERLMSAVQSGVEKVLFRQNWLS